MNRVFKSAAGLFLAVCAFSFSGCDDESNVIGLNEDAKYGYIKLTFDGTRPDGEDFKTTRNYKFMTSSGPASSSTLSIIDDGGTYYYFHATRLFTPFDASNNGYSTVDLDAIENDGEFDISRVTVAARSALTFKDKTAFNLNLSSWELSPSDVTSFSYTESTGKLVIKFKTVVDSDSNNSGYDLTVTGEVRVIVFRSLNSIG